MSRLALIIGLVKVLVDFGAILVGFMAARVLRESVNVVNFLGLGVIGVPDKFEYVIFALGVAVVFVLTGVFERLYVFARYTLVAELVRILWALVIVAGFLLVYFFAVREIFFSRLVFLWAFLIAFAVMVLGRVVIYRARLLLYRWGWWQERVVVVGSGAEVERVVAKLKEDSCVELVGVVERVVDLLAEEERWAVVERVVHVGGRNLSFDVDLIRFARRNNVVYLFLPDDPLLLTPNVSFVHVFGVNLIEVRNTPLDGWGRIIKRVSDIVIAVVSLVVLLPLLLLIAVVVGVSSRGPIFYVSERVGRYGQVFSMFKFRTMVVGAEGQKADLQARNERLGPLFKMVDDPRITGLGRFLRRSSLDELPQLVNIIRGEMSLVGPRPHEAGEVSQYTTQQKRLLSITPGLTSLAAVSGRSSLPFYREAQLDTFYIENWSLYLDITIVLRTIMLVLLRRDVG